LQRLYAGAGHKAIGHKSVTLSPTAPSRAHGQEGPAGLDRRQRRAALAAGAHDAEYPELGMEAIWRIEVK
jgi:hypothetical protein